MEIHVSIERVTIRLTGEIMDIFDRIVAGIAALQAGNTTELAAHVSEIDNHLQNVDGEVLGLQTDDNSTKGRLDAIEAGLGKVADAVAPAAPASGGTDTGGSAGAPASGGTAGAPAAADGSTSADVGPSAHASAPIPSSGVGSEVTGQVDTPTPSA